MNGATKQPIFAYHSPPLHKCTHTHAHRHARTYAHTPYSLYSDSNRHVFIYLMPTTVAIHINHAQ